MTWGYQGDDRFEDTSLLDLEEMLRQQVALGPDAQGDGGAEFIKDVANEIAQRKKFLAKRGGKPPCKIGKRTKGRQ